MANIRPLIERDLNEPQRIVRRAFGTFMDVPDLDNFWTDSITFMAASALSTPPLSPPSKRACWPPSTSRLKRTHS